MGSASKNGMRGRLMNKYGFTKTSRSNCWCAHWIGVGGIYVDFVGNMSFRLRVAELGIDKIVKNTSTMHNEMDAICEIENSRALRWL